ncbi:odorant receptor 2a-like [Cotesia glomerata]|uniref:odorant receptor 2a-like n=1 Tax=Cotesia glomerata TaxID=32391 RepID=UPI001D0287D1|nr:odorant receptor 2a-like [Cotesia glomerata]
MKIFEENLTLLFFLGMWKPTEWSPGNYKSVLYTIYTFLIIIISGTFFITELLDLILVTSNIAEFTNNIFMLSAIFAACFKILIILLRRNVLNNIIDDLKNYMLKNDKYSKEEIIIWTRYSHIIKFLSLFYMSSTFFGVTMMTFATVSVNISRRELLYRAWVPYNYSRPIAYWVSALGQLLGMYILAGVNVGFVLLFSGILISTCSLINILLFRKVQNLFSLTMAFQYCLGSIIFCTSAYNMSKMKVLSFEFLSCVLYVSNIMIELFIICFSTNEMTLEFGKLHNAFYDCQWYLLNNENKKLIGLLMTNSIKPVHFTCVYVLNLSLESFSKVLKLSYSIYNLLQSAF